MHRERLGLTQADVAEQLARLAWFRRHLHVGVNADMISKWERGTKSVSRLYQELFCLLYATTPEQIGFRPRVTQSCAETDEAVLLSSAIGITSILNQLGDASQLIHPAVLDAWKEEAVQRRTLLKLLGVTPAVLSVSDTQRNLVTVTTPAAITMLDELASSYQRLYHSTSPADLITPVLAHIKTVGDLLRKLPDPRDRRRLLRNRSHVSLLAGRLAFFDLHDSMRARGYYNLAIEAACEAGDDLLGAAAYGHLSFIPADDGSFSAAQDYLRAAEHHLARAPHRGVSSWLAAVETEIQANAGAEVSALAAAERAQTTLPHATPAASLPWFDFYDATRLAGFQGYAFLRFGRFTEATGALLTALNGLPPHAVKQRAVFLADLATVHLRAADVDEACRIASDAADNLSLAGYATGMDRLRDLRAQLTPWNTHPGVRALDERLAVA